MSWDYGGGKGNRNPWGSDQPDLEAQLRATRRKLKGLFPGGFEGARGMGILAVMLAGIWAASGFYLLDETEQAVILRFGKYKETVERAGIHYHLPYPFEVRLVKDVSTTQTYGIAKSFIVTGDENIVNAGFSLQYYISDLKSYFLNAVNPEETLQIAAVTAFRDVVAQATAQEVMATDRNRIAGRVQKTLQDLVDDYQLGLRIVQLDLQDVDPPATVRDAYLDVQRAVTDRENLINEAEAYSNKVVEEAQGFASRIRQDAMAYKAERLELARGEAQQFEDVYRAYEMAPEATQKRLYLETIEKVLGDAEDIMVVDPSIPVLPHAALPAFKTRQGE